MNIGGLIYESLVDGSGVRTVVFISGCKHRCEGCHNQQLFDFDYGVPFDKELQHHVINYIKGNPLISGLTISGGDAMYSWRELQGFLKDVKKQLPDHDIWLYTGFTFEDIEKNPVIDYIDVLVDGVYEKDKPCDRFVGSNNQRIIDVKRTLNENKIILWRGD